MTTERNLPTLVEAASVVAREAGWVHRNSVLRLVQRRDLAALDNLRARAFERAGRETWEPVRIAFAVLEREIADQGWRS